MCARTNEAFMLFDMNVTTISLVLVWLTLVLVRMVGVGVAGAVANSGCTFGEYVKTGLSE